MNSNSDCTKLTTTTEDERKTLMHKLLLKKFQGIKNLDKKVVCKRSEPDVAAFADKAKSFQIHTPTKVDSGNLSGQSISKERKSLG